MADIVQFKKKKKPKKKKSLNPFRVLGAFLALLFMSITLLPFVVMCLITLPFMPKKYYERLNEPLNEMNEALHDVLRMIQGEEKENNTKDR